MRYTKEFQQEAEFVMQRTNNHVHVKDAISGKRRPLPGCLSKKDSVFFFFGIRLKHFQFRLVEGSRKFRDRQALLGKQYYDVSYSHCLEFHLDHGSST